MVPFTRFVEHLKERKEQIDLKDFSFAEAAKRCKNDFSDASEQSREILTDLAKRYEGFTPNAMLFLHGPCAKDLIDSPYGFDGRNLSDKEQAFLNGKLKEYSKGLANMLVTQFSYGDPKMEMVVRDHLARKPLKKSELIDYFVCSGGKTDASQMSSWEKAQVTMRLAFSIR